MPGSSEPVTKTSGLAVILDLLDPASDSQGFFVFSGPGESGCPKNWSTQVCGVARNRYTSFYWKIIIFKKYVPVSGWPS